MKIKNENYFLLILSRENRELKKMMNLILLIVNHLLLIIKMFIHILKLQRNKLVFHYFFCQNNKNELIKSTY